jgi:hypothetical protein
MNTPGARLDYRDRWNTKHMKRRMEVASHYPLERQLRDAQHLQRIALFQRRILLLMLAVKWEHEIRAAMLECTQK